MKIEPIKVEYVDHLGSDLTVINAARVSFDKQHNVFDKSDEKLIKYLADHSHWSPFAHCQIQFRITAPIFVARQAFKHQVGIIQNEVSRRYVDTEPSFFMPDKWRRRAENKKQGSSDVEILSVQKITSDPYVDENNLWAEDFGIVGCSEYAEQIYKLCQKAYDEFLEAGVCPEQARMLLPQGMMTSWFWTGSLFAFARVYNLRSSPDAQKEIQDMARMIGEIAKDLFPFSWEVLCGG